MAPIDYSGLLKEIGENPDIQPCQIKSFDFQRETCDKNGDINQSAKEKNCDSGQYTDGQINQLIKKSLTADQQQYKNGVRKIGPYEGDLRRFVGINRNIMTFPICVLDPKAKVRGLQFEWVSYSLQKKRMVKHKYYAQMVKNSDGMSEPFPITVHAKYLDALLGLYANNLPSKGEKFRFKVGDIAKILNINSDKTFYKNFYEMLKRYNNFIARWDESYLDLGDRVTVKTNSSFILSYIDREECRNSHCGWNEIMIHPKIDETIRNLDTRLFYSQVFKEKLKKMEYHVYRYFYSFADNKEIRRKLKHVKECLTYTGKKDKFVKYLKTNLDALKNLGLVEYYDIPKVRNPEKFFESEMVVKCKSFTVGKKVDLNKVASEELIDVYESLFASGKIVSETHHMPLIHSNDKYLDKIRNEIRQSCPEKYI